MDKTEITISCLQHAIEDAQDTIKAYDAKAEILGVLLTIAIGITNFTFLQHTSPTSKAFLIASWIIGLLSIGFLGAVLYPQRDPFKKIQFGGYTPSGTYFLTQLNTSAQNTVTQLADNALNTNWVNELTYENMKLSIIRDYKHCWYVRALRVSGLSLLLIAIMVFIEYY